jgi:hypothetical protein
MHSRMPRWLALLLAIALLAPAFVAAPRQAEARDLSRPVLAWYYGWWTNDNWNRMSDYPSELYNSNSDDVMRRQIRQARGAGIDGFICTYHYNCVRLLQLAEAESGFSVAFSIDPGADARFNSFNNMVNEMNALKGHTNSPAYLRYQGKPVMVFWDSNIIPGGSSVARFQDLRSQVDPGRNQFWLGGGIDFNYLDVFDAIQYFDISWESAPGVAMASYNNRLNGYNASRGANKPFIATVMPGYDDVAYRNGHRRDRENGGYYNFTWTDAFRYNPAMVIITSWNEWYEGSQIEPSRSYGEHYLNITRERTHQFRNQPRSFADPAMLSTWNRTDKAVADGYLSRSWVWGYARTTGQQEIYGGGTRLVQYFDKSRMEINNPGGDRNSQWFVTNGLLVVEMISGRLQLGDQTFQQRQPSDEVLAGDPRAHNPNVPGYGSLAQHLGRTGDRTGQVVNQQLQRNGSLTQISPPHNVTVTRYEGVTGHNIAGIFWDYMNQQGQIWSGSGYVNGPIVDWLFAFGYPISEPYWMGTRIGGQEQWVLVQAFERRVLTYTPTNQPAFQVEMGNVGQHYHAWRYGWSW